MPITKQKKAEIVQRLQREVVTTPAAVFVNFHGLKVSEATELRKGLRSEGVGLLVAKKTLIRRAWDEQLPKGEWPELPGEIAVAYPNGATDSLAPARGIQSFVKKFKERLAIAGGVYEGEFLTADQMTELSLIPGREVLYGRLVALLISPVRKLVVTLDQVAKSKN
jgi:large subunit ribosomal protein L10